MCTSGVSKYFLNCGEKETSVSHGTRITEGVQQLVCCSHLQAEGSNDRLVVADSVAHITGVFILGDEDWILVLSIISGGGSLLIVILRRWGFGFDAPEDPIRPGWFPLLAAGQSQGKC